MRIVSCTKFLGLISTLGLSACVLVDQSSGGGPVITRAVVDCANPEPDFKDYTNPAVGTVIPDSFEDRKRKAVAVFNAKCLGCHSENSAHPDIITTQRYNDNYWNDPCYIPHPWIGVAGDPANSPLMQTLKRPSGTGLPSVNGFTGGSMPQGGVLTVSEYQTLWDFILRLDDP